MSEPIPEFSDEKIAAFRNAIEGCMGMLKDFPFEAWRYLAKAKRLDEETKMAMDLMEGGVKSMRSCADDLYASIKTLRDCTEILKELAGVAGHFNSEWAKVKRIAQAQEFKTLQSVLEMHKSGLLTKICYLANEIPSPERSVGSSIPDCSCATTQTT